MKTPKKRSTRVNTGRKPVVTSKAVRQFRQADMLRRVEEMERRVEGAVARTEELRAILDETGNALNGGPPAPGSVWLWESIPLAARALYQKAHSPVNPDVTYSPNTHDLEMDDIPGGHPAPAMRPTTIQSILRFFGFYS